MGTKFTISVLLLLLTTAFIYNSAVKHTPAAKRTAAMQNSSPFSDKFYICALGWGEINTTNEYHDTLGLNLWHQYPIYGNRLQKGWTNQHAPADTLTAHIENFGWQIEELLRRNNSDSMKTLMHRIKIDYLAMGQRSDYQCESEGYIANSDLWFYTYSNSPNNTWIYDETDNTIYGEGARVKHCQPDPQNAPEGAGYAVSGLKANREQINYYAYSSRYMADQLFRWYIKPRIRIDTAYANNPANNDNLVCKIEVLNFNGDMIKSTNIRVLNFKDSFGKYEGGYKEEFNFGDNDSTLYIDPIPDPQKPDEPTYNTNPFNPGHKGDWDENCKVDIKVYWYGYCDMWIDYVRVENQIAYDLFSGIRDQWIKWETELADYLNNGAQLYIEEFHFNNVPCMSFVARKIREYSNGKFNLMCVLNWGEYVIHIPGYVNNQPDISFVKRNLIDTLQLREFCDFAYPLNGYEMGSEYNKTPVYVPNTLPVSSYSHDSGRLSIDVPPWKYDKWLQGYLDESTSWVNDNFIRWMKHGDTISKSYNLPFVTLIQTHLWHLPEYMLREPTNEEMQMMVNVSLTYGARGILYFWYPNWGRIGSEYYGRGFTGGYPDSDTLPRRESVYGQNKWQCLTDINRKLNVLGHYFTSFDNQNRHSYIYRFSNERDALINNTYFRDIITYKPGSGLIDCAEYSPPLDDIPPEGWIIECPDDRYIQAATFKKIDDDGNYYFMIVNRRCSPYRADIEENGGRRFIRFYYDANAKEFEGYDWWKVTLLGSDDPEEIQLDKRTWGYIDLGYFMPGEGRLYKISPVQ